MKDFIGNEIQVGDTIIYAGRRGSSLWLTEALVVGVETRAARYGGPLTQPVIEVRPIIHATEATPTQAGAPLWKKKVTITNGSTVCVTKPAEQA